MSRRMLFWVLLVSAALPLIVGCQFLRFSVCAKNLTDFYLDEFAVKTAGAPTYPGGAIKVLAPGRTATAGRYAAGSYDFRAIFDVSDSNVCDDTVEILGVVIESSNVIAVYEVQDIGKGDCSEEIYVTLDYVL